MTRHDGPSVARPLTAALGLAVLEVGWVTVATREPFRDGAEWAWFAATSLTTVIAICLVLWAAASMLVRAVGAHGTERDPVRRTRSARRLSVVAAVVIGIGGFTGLWATTAGRRLRDMPGRTLGVFILSVLAAWVAAWLCRAMVERTRHPRPGGWGGAATLAVVAGAALVLDGAILRRLYPAVHAMLSAMAVFGSLGAAVLAPRRRLGRWAAWPVAVGLVAMAPLSLRLLLERSNAAFVVERWAPVTGKLVRLVRPAMPLAPVPPRVAASPMAEPDAGRAPGLDLRGRSALVITVDALRADRLAAYGGSGLTPHMDALAARGVVFERAFTPTPHTSYALASLWTGQDLHLLGRREERIPTSRSVAERLGATGYRTAAFFPPAVFYVDADKLGRLAHGGFGFDHRVMEAAAAPERVEQLRRWLEQVPAGPLLSWVHLFEPHEPYDPPAGWARGDDDAGRYDGEVAFVDAAVGELVSLFRKHRPDATIVLTADHGEELGDHGGHFHGTSLYDEQIRVPLVWSLAGAEGGRRVAAPVELTDVAVTLLSTAGVPPGPTMTGDDLGPVLAERGRGPRYAFASVRDVRMATDGLRKVICTVGRSDCRMYDLRSDPREQRNVAEDRPAVVQRLRAAIGRHLASIASSSGAADTRAVIDRAAMGDPTVGPALVPLLASDDPVVRAGAARELGRLGHGSARTMLHRMALRDPDPSVRIESAIAAIHLGDHGVVGVAEEAITVGRTEGKGAVPERIGRAALALAEAGSPLAVPELVAVARGQGHPVEVRRTAVVALGELRARSAVPSLIDLLHDIRLRIDVARALGRIGDRRATEPLVRALRREPYPGAREAEVEALRALRHPGVRALARRYLGSSPAR